MDKLWAPWRVKYITTILKKTKGCVFCKILKQKQDKKNFIYIRSKHCFCVLNIYPYNNGHILILPYRHVAELSKLTKQEKQDLFELLEINKTLIDKVLKPSGYNVGINLGRSAGAGYPDHLHIHMVPRWKSDVNFMPVTADTKVISQSLKTIYDLLKDAYQKRH